MSLLLDLSKREAMVIWLNLNLKAASGREESNGPGLKPPKHMRDSTLQNGMPSTHSDFLRFVWEGK